MSSTAWAGSPVDVYFSETETYQPDLVFVSKERAAIITEQKVDGAPDLVVEVLALAEGAYESVAEVRGSGTVASKLLDGFSVDSERLFTF